MKGYRKFIDPGTIFCLILIRIVFGKEKVTSVKEKWYQSDCAFRLLGKIYVYSGIIVIILLFLSDYYFPLP